MKKLNRFISFVVLAAFLVNSTLTDLAFAQNSTDKLAIASRFDDLMGPQGQDMSRIRFMLAGHIAGAKDGDSINLPRLIENVSTYSDSSAAHKSRIEFEPMQVFGHEMRPLPSNLMYVMCRVRHKFLGLHTYYAVFPRTWEGEGFPIEVYTEKEWSENKIYEFLADNYIHRRSDHKPSAAAAIERDVVHQGFDSVLQWAHDPSNAEHIRTIDSIGMDYRASMSDIMNRFREFGIIISGSDNPDIRPIEDREPSIVVISGPVKERLVRNMVSLKAIDGTPLDVIPAAHLSNNYLNTLLTTQEIRTLSKGGKNADRIKKDIIARWVHEVGVSVGLPVIFFNGLRPVNLFDLLWEHDGNFEAVRHELDAHKVDAITAGFKGNGTYKIQDLDTNIETRDAASVSGLWDRLTGRSRDPKRADPLPKKVLSALGIRDVTGITVTPIYNIYKMVVTRSRYLSIIKSSDNDILLQNLDARNGHYFSPNHRYLFVRSSDHEATVYDLMAPDIAHMAIMSVEDLGDEYPFDKSSRFIRVYDNNFVEIIYDLNTGKALPPKTPAPVVAAPAPGGEGRAVETPAAASVDSSGVRAEPIDAAQPQQSSERADTLPKLEGMEEFADAAARAVANSAPSSSSPWKDFGSSGKSSPEEKDPASDPGEIFEIASGTAQSVIPAFKDFFDASIGSSRQKRAAVILESHAEVTYAFARAVLDVMESRNISRRPNNFGSVAMSAYETVLMASHSSKGMMTKGDPRFNNLKSLMEKVEHALPHNSMLRAYRGAVSRQGGSGEAAPGFEMASTTDEESAAIESITTFEEVFKGAKRKNEKEAIYRQISDEIELTSMVIEDMQGEGAIKTARIGVVPGGEQGATLIMHVDRDVQARTIGIYQSFIEGIARLASLVNGDEARRKVITALIEGAVMHEMGHSLERYSGIMDMQSFFEDSSVRDYMAEILNIHRKADWDDNIFTHVVAQAVAESVTGGQGNANFVQNKSAYLFYKYLSFSPEGYVSSTGAIDQEKIAAKIKAYYEANPHLEKWTGNNVEAMIDQTTADFVAFFGEGTQWNRSFVSNAAVVEEPVSDEEKAARAAAKTAAEARRPEILNLLKRSYDRKLTSDERANARRNLQSLSNNPLLLPIICEEAKRLEATLSRNSLEANMLRDTMKPINLLAAKTKGAVSRQGGTGEFPPLYPVAVGKPDSASYQETSAHSSMVGLYGGWQIEVNVPRVGILFPHSVKNVMDNWVAPYLKKYGSNISKDTLKSWLQLGNNYSISVDETAGGLVFSMMGNVHALHEEVVCSGKISRGIKTPPQLELLRPIYKSDIKLAALDWDGTISRIREGWEGIMAPLVAALVSGIEITPDEWKGILECVKNDKPVDKKYLSRLSDESISWALEMINETKGEPTPTQFGRACEEARTRGNGELFKWVLDYYRAKGETIDETNPQKYFCKYYLEKLYELRDYRLALVDSGAVDAGEYLVKGGVEFIRMLVGGGVRVVIVTGSDQKGVQQEVDILGLGDLVEVTGYDVEKEIASKYDIIKNLKESSGYRGDQILVMGDGKVEIKAGVELRCKTIALRSRDNAGILFDTKILPLEPDAIMSSHFEPVNELAEFLLPEQKEHREALMETIRGSLAEGIMTDYDAALGVLKEANELRKKYFVEEVDKILREQTDFAVRMPERLKVGKETGNMVLPAVLQDYLRHEAAQMAREAVIFDGGSYFRSRLAMSARITKATGFQRTGNVKFIVNATSTELGMAYKDAFKRYYGFIDGESLPEYYLGYLRGLAGTRTNAARIKKSADADSFRSDMVLNTETMHNISAGMISHMSEGLKGEPSSLDMTPTFVTAPTGKEKGDYFAIDVGGSNLRVMGVRLDGNGGYEEIGEAKVVKFTSKLKTGSQEELFDFIARTVKKYFSENGIDKSGEIHMGLSWSFPVELTGIASARHKEWTKGWDVRGVVGEDVVDLLHSAFERSKIGNAKIVALCNDTTGTLAAARYAGYEDCIGGMVLGTGWNAAFELPTRHIGKWVAFDGSNMMVNTEWENYSLPLLTKWDEELDARPEVHGKQMLEKHVSGKYLGEIARLIIRDLVLQNKIFDGKMPKIFGTAPVELGKDGFITDYMSVIEGDESPDLVGVAKLLQRFGVKDPSKEDCKTVRSVCELVSKRSAQIVASATDALISYVESTAPRQSYSIAVDGSLYEKYPHFAERISAALKSLRPNDHRKIKFVTAKDGSGVGAAIIAAAVSSKSAKPAFPQDYHARKAALEKLAKERGFMPFLGAGAIPLYNEANGTNHSLKAVMNNAELQSNILIWAIEEFNLDGIPAMMDLTIETEAALLANIPEDKRKEILAPYGRDTFSKFDEVDVPQMEPDLTEKAGTEWWKNPKEFDVRTVGRMKVQAETIRRLKARFGKSKVIAGYVVAPYTLAEHFMGSNMMSGHDAFTSMLSETEEFKAMMAYSEKLIAQYAKLLIESGADVIAMLDPTPTGNIGPVYSRLHSIAPVNRLARFIRENGALAAFHPCEPQENTQEGNEMKGDLEVEYLKAFAEANVDILSLDAVYDSGKVSEELGPLTLDTVYDFIEEHSAAKPVIIGSVNTDSVLPNGTPEEVTASVNRQINALSKKSRGYLIGSSCDITTTLANMRAFAKAVFTNSQYTNAIHVPDGHPDLKVEQARHLPSDGIWYVDKDGKAKKFYPNDRLVPTVGVRPRFGHDGRLFTVGELAERGVLGSPQEKLIVVPNDDAMTHVSGDILTSIMDAASYLYNIGLATGGTTEALRKLMGLPGVLKKTYGRTIDAEKIMKICTLDNYYFEDYLKRRGLSQDEADYVLEVSSYENEQLYMMIENMMRGVNGWQFFAPPSSTDLGWLESSEQFRQMMKRHFVLETYLHYRGVFVKHAHQLWQLHGIGTDSHDAFNEVFMHLVDTSILSSRLIRYKTGEVKHAYLPDGTDLAELGLVNLPPSGRIPDSFLMPLLRDDHASWIHPGTEIQNAGHFTDDLHPFFLKLIGDKSAYDWDEIIASILALTPDELLNYSKNPKYHFRDMRHFVDELNKVISQYANVPYESTSQGTGAILNRGSMPLPDGSYPLQLFMACAAHKQLATLRAVLAQTPSDMQWSTAAAVLHMAKNAILVATQESLDMVYERDYEAIKTRFIRVEPDAAGLNDAAEAGWRETPPGKRITESLRKHRGEKETPGPNAEDDVGGTDVLSDGGVITGRDWTREGPDMYRNRANPAVVARRNPITGRFDHTGGNIDLETARFNTNRAREVIAVIAKSGSLQRMIQQNIGFRLPDYTAVCPDELQKSAAEDLDMLVDRGVLVRDESRTYRPTSAWSENINKLRKTFAESGKIADDDALIEGRYLLSGTKDLATQVGMEIPTLPGERYRLLVPQSFFAEGELDNDKNKFGDRFELDGVKGETGGDIVRSIIRHARDNEGRSIAVIPNSIRLTDKNIGDLQSLGIGFIRVDAEAISELRFATAAERAQFRMDTYAIMWLARYVRDATPESGAHELLRFYLKTHFAFASPKEMEDYIDALVKGELARLANAYLRYRPSMPKDAEADYHRVAASLIFA